MSTHGNSAQERLATPHATTSITNQTISDAVKRRAQSLINDSTIDANGRTWLRYALEIKDPALPELVRRADAAESNFSKSEHEWNGPGRAKTRSIDHDLIAFEQESFGESLT